MDSIDKDKNQKNNNNKRNKSQTNLKLIAKDQIKSENKP